MRKFVFFTALLIFSSCAHEKEGGVDLNKMIQFDEKKGVLIIKEDKKHLVKIVEIRSDSNSKQNVLIDSTNKISEVQNVITVGDNHHFVNTWIGFDYQKNFDYSKSYYYETSLLNENEHFFVECYLPNLIYNNPKCFVLLNNFDKQFRSDKPSDTLWFDKNYLVKIPIRKYNLGLNNIKFIIVEGELIGNRLKVKKTYVDKDFIVAKRKNRASN